LVTVCLFFPLKLLGMVVMICFGSVRRANALDGACIRAMIREEARMSKREQISVPLNPDLRAFVEQAAERADRSVASMIRHWISQEARRAEAQAGAEAA
jgi:hypothetical protein